MAQPTFLFPRTEYDEGVLASRNIDPENLLDEDAHDMEHIVQEFQRAVGEARAALDNLWERLRVKHDIDSKAGDLLIVPSLDRALFRKPDSLPMWVIQSPLLPYLHYYVVRGRK